MTAWAWALLAAASVLALSDWLAVARGWKPVEYVCKPATLAALIGVAVVLHPARGDVRAWFVAALALSLAGDVFLMLPADLFAAGLGSFLLAHVAFVAGLTRHGGAAAAVAIAALPVALVAGTLARRFLGAVVALGERELVGPLVAYMVAIAALVTTALASGNVWAGAGAVLFLVSDALIAETRFVGPRRWGPVAIMVMYHLGQVGLTLSLLH